MRLMLAAALLMAASAQANNDPLKKSVVKIFTVMKPADYYQPWQLAYQQQGTGSGLVIEGRRILTNAHVVSDQVNLQVMKAGDTRKYDAKLEFVGHDTELAMLSVEEPDFFKDTTAISFGEVPRQRDKVAAYGFPAGGEELSITEGVVSRIELQTYVHSQRSLLTIQTDAAINPGNSGGPVFKEGKCIGISFQSFSGSRVENTGYIIPVPIINRFLKDITDGKYDGVPALGVFLQKVESPALKDFYRLPKGLDGLAVSRIIPGSPASAVLKEGDVITAFDGVRLASNGTIPFREGERVYFSHLLSRYQMGDKAKLTVWRGAKALELDLAFNDFQGLVPRPQYDIRPSYFVFGGLVFMPLTFNYINAWGFGNAPVPFRFLYDIGMPSPDKKRVVFINVVLPHKVNKGYESMNHAVVAAINGKPISDMPDVIEAFKSPKDGFHVIEVDKQYAEADDAGSLIVLKADEVEKANAEILTRNAITSDRSEDLK